MTRDQIIRSEGLGLLRLRGGMDGGTDESETGHIGPAEDIHRQMDALDPQLPGCRDIAVYGQHRPRCFADRDAIPRQSDELLVGEVLLPQDDHLRPRLGHHPQLFEERTAAQLAGGYRDHGIGPVRT